MVALHSYVDGENVVAEGAGAAFFHALSEMEDFREGCPCHLRQYDVHL
jgi:hypothetical protein